MLAPRGVRNNNAFNVRKDQTKWLGLSDTQTDAQFFQFVTPEYGIRAAVKILQHYQAEGVKTIYAAIARWAPPTENNTSAYIAAVCEACNAKPSDDFQISVPFLKAMITHENGVQPYSDEQIAKGISMAGENAPLPVKASWAPSGSTTGSSLGACVATLVIGALHQWAHLDLDSTTTAALVGLCTILAGYIPPSGRK